MNSNEPLGVLLRLVLSVIGAGLIWGTAGVAFKNFIDRLMDRREHNTEKHHNTARSY